MITDTLETHTFGPSETTTEDHPTKRDKKKKRKPHIPVELVIILLDSMMGLAEERESE